MRQILISYRREDSIDVTGRIYDRLVAHFGAECVFMDVDTIPFGVDFRTYLTQWVHRADTLLVVVGDQWLDARYGDGPKAGEPRLGDPEDYVTIEVAAALRRDIPVIPVLVGNMTMPAARQLPEDLKDLTYRNAAEVRSGRDFHAHMDRLIRGLESLVPPLPAPGESVAEPGQLTSEVVYVYVEPPAVPEPTNLGFDEHVVDGLPIGWFDSLGFVGGVSVDYEVSVLSRGDGDEGRCVRMHRTGARVNEFGSLMQRCPAHGFVGKDLRLEAEIRSEAVVSWAGAWLRIDGRGQHLFFENMDQDPIKGTTPWTTYRIEAQVPDGSEWLNFGFLLAGDGTIWADNFALLAQGSDGVWNPVQL